jgi:hypothetical protein
VIRLVRLSIFSLIEITRRSCATVRFCNSVIDLARVPDVWVLRQKNQQPGRAGSHAPRRHSC